MENLKHQNEDFRYSREKIFTGKKPRSRLLLDIVKKLRKKIEEQPDFNHPGYIKYEGVEQIEGEYYLLKNQSEELVSLSSYLTDNSPSLQQIANWSLDIAEICKQAEKAGYDWSGFSLEYFQIDRNDNIKLINPEVIEIISQYRDDVGIDFAAVNFMPPEIIEQQEWDQQSRIYSLGIVLYYLITGELPFAGKDKSEIFDKIVMSSFVEPRFINFEISSEFSNLILKMLARDRNERIQSWSQLIEELQQISSENKITATDKVKQENKDKSKKVVKSLKFKQGFYSFFRHYWKTVAIVVVVFLGIGFTLFTGGSKPVVTKTTTPEQVVKYFYQGVNEKDIIKVDDTTDMDLKNLDRMVSQSHVMEKMRQVYGGDLQASLQPNDGSTNKTDSEQKVFGIEKLKITELEKNPQPHFKAEYNFYINRPEGKRTVNMEDQLWLKKVKNRWQIVNIKGDMAGIILGNSDKVE